MIRFKHGECKRDCPPADLRIKNRTLRSPTSIQELIINLPKNSHLREIRHHHHHSTEKGQIPLKTFLNKWLEGKILFSFSFIENVKHRGKSSVSYCCCHHKNTASDLWRLHYTDRPCSLGSCCFRWPSSKTDTDQLVRVLKLDHFQKPELGFTVLEEKV